MKKIIKIINFILPYLFFILYASLVIIAPRYFYEGIQNNQIITFVSYLIIFTVAFTLLYGVIRYFKLLSKTMNPLSNKNFLDFTSLIDDQVNQKGEVHKRIIKEGTNIILLHSFIFVLEMLFPFALAYVTMSPYASFSSFLILKYFLNIFVFNTNENKAIPAKDIPHITSMIEEVKKELGIKRKIYVCLGLNLECSLLIENSKIYISLGPDLLTILKTNELKSLLYSLLLNFDNDDFEANLKLTRLSNLIAFFTYKCIVPLDLLSSGLFLAKTSFYLQVVSENNQVNYILKLKGTPYVKDFLKAKLKKTRYHLLNTYLDPIDYTKVDPKNYFISALEMKRSRLHELVFIDELAKVSLHTSREMELSYSEVREILKEEDVTIDDEFNLDFKEDLEGLTKASPLLKEENVNKRYRRYISSLESCQEFEKEFVEDEASFDDKVQFALSKFIQRDYEGSLNYALKLAQENPNDDSLCLLIGNIYIKAYNSPKCEEYLFRNFFKHEIIITATNLLEDFYSHNGLKDKLKSLEPQMMEAQKVLLQDRLERQNIVFGDEDISAINRFSKTNSEIIEKIKEYKEVNHLIMFDKYSQNSYHLYIILGLDDLNEQEVVDEIKEYLLNRDDVNVIVKVFTNKDKKILTKFKDHVIY